MTRNKKAGVENTNSGEWLQAPDILQHIKI